MPVYGEPTPFTETLLIPRPNETVRKAVETLASLFPKPNNYFSSIGFQMRKRRLGVELAEFDFLHRLLRGRPADLDTLCRVGEAIILPGADRFPTHSLPLDEPLLVTPKTFSLLIRVSEGNGASSYKARHPKRRANSSSKQGDMP
jgi:hypothetical protein